jgi:tape measure domain-containing protein
MSEVIDNRVLEMRFDNRQFESGVATTLSTLDKLKQKLNLSGASKGLEDVGMAAKGIDLSGLGAGIQTVQAKFSALGVMGATVLVNLTNQAYSAGKKISEALTLQPLKDGFAEYETQMDAVQTILANTQKDGTNIAQVNAALDELNTYADKTIYNFTQMTRNIGTFTAAGVKLDTSVKSIQGIANLAAVSGSTSQQASTAMYQLSQAIAAGSVKLQDWNSVVNAGMGGQVFQDALIRTSEHLQTGAKAAIAAKGSFRESLQEGWITTEVLTQTLEQLSTAADTTEEYEAAVKKFVDQGYTQEEAKQMADLARTAGNAATKVKTFSQLIDTLQEALGSGWTKSWQLIIGDFEEAKELWTGVSDTLSDMINKSADARNDLIQGWVDLGGRSSMIESFKNSFTALGKVISPIKEAFREIFPKATSEQLYNITENIRKFTESLIISDSNGEKLKVTFKGIFSVLDIGIEAMKSGVKGIREFASNFKGFNFDLLDFTSSLGEYLANLRESVIDGNLFDKVVSKIIDTLSTGISKVKEFGKSLKQSADESMTLQGIAGFLQGFFGVIKGIGSAVVNVFEDIGKTISKAFGKGNMFEVFNSGLFSGFLVLINNFVNTLSDTFENMSFLESVQDILGGVKDTLEAYQKNLQADTLLKIAGAVGVLAAALFVIATIDSDKLGASLLSVGTLFVELTGAMAVLSKIDSGSTKPLSGIVSSLASIVKTVQMIGLTAAVVILAGAMKILATLDWDGIEKGLVGVAGLVAILVSAAKLMNTESKSITKFAGQMILMSVAIGALTAVGKYIASMSWDEMKKGGAGILGLTTILMTACKIMDTDSRSITKFAGQMILMSAALAALIPTIKSFGGMSWTAIGKGLTVIGTSLLEFSIGLKAMNGSKKGASALLVAVAALRIFVPVLESLGNMDANAIVQSLITLGSTFAVFGAAGLILKPLVPTLLGLAGAFALFAAATVGIGIGLTTIAAGFSMLSASVITGATALVAGLGVITTGILGLVPEITEIIGKGIVQLAAVLGEYAPQLAESFLRLISESLSSLAKYTPEIVDSLLIFAIGLINGVAEHAPELIAAATHLIDSVIKGIFSALNGLDAKNLLIGVLAVSGLTGLIYALAGITSLIPSAMAGLAGVGAVLAELVGILAVVGGIAQIPGLEWLVTEGGDFLQKIGTAIGQFTGGIIGGVAEGVISTLPRIGNDLSMFMLNIQTFVEGAKQIDSSLLESIQTLSATILILAGTNVVDAIASFFSGNDHFSRFSKQLTAFGEGMKQYGEAVSGLNTRDIENSAAAAEAIVKVVDVLPSSGGVAQFFSGKHDLSRFGKALIPFGEGMKQYGEAVSGIDTGSILTSVLAANAIVAVANAIPTEGGLWQLLSGSKDLDQFANKLVPFAYSMKYYGEIASEVNTTAIIGSTAAANAMISVANAIPVTGGFWSLFDGDRDLGDFGKKLIPFGEGMKSYAEAVSNIDTGAILSSALAANAIIGVANAIPVTGGFWSLFDGDRDLSKFGTKLIPFGYGMKYYADAVSGIDTGSIISSTLAANAIIGIANSIPMTGGFWSLFNGDKDLGDFGKKLIPFGEGMRLYANIVADLDAMSIVRSADAASAIVDVANAIPITGGFWSLFDGDKDLSKFGTKLIPFGYGMKSYADAVAEIDTQAIARSIIAANGLIDVANAIPTEGGFWTLIDGKKEIGDFGQKLIPFGNGLKSYSEAVDGLSVGSILTSAVAANSLIGILNSLPTEGGFWTIINGDKEIGNFGKKLVPFGEGMKSYAEAVTGIDETAIIRSAGAAYSLIGVAEAIPTEGGIWELFQGGKDLGNFGQKLVPFGEGMQQYAAAVTGLKPSAISSSVPGVKSMVSVIESIPANLNLLVSVDSISGIGEKLTEFGKAMIDYSETVNGLNAGSILSSVEAAKSIVEVINSTAGMYSGGVSSFVDSVNKFAEANIDDFVKVFDGASGKMESAGKKMLESLLNGMKPVTATILSTLTALTTQMNSNLSSKASMFHGIGATLMNKFVSGIKSKNDNVVSGSTSGLSSAVKNMRSYYSSFYSAGSYVAGGFSSGIRANIQSAASAAARMASAASNAARQNLKIHSPSRVFKEIGSYVPQGFAQGISMFGGQVKKSVSTMADTATSTTQSVLAQMLSMIDSNIDAQPTISPVVDLSNARSGISALNGMFSTGQTIGIRASLNDINTSMNYKNQNGDIGEVISAINKLRKDIGNMEHATYQINGITYDDGSNISDAISTIVKAARIGRRV